MSKLMMLVLVHISSAHASGLLDAYEAAKLHDPTYLAAIAEQQAKLQEVPIARAAFLPQVSANYRRGETSESLVAPDLPFVVPGAVDYLSSNYGIRLTQTLYNKAQFANYSRAKMVAIETHLELQKTEQELIVRVAKAYINTLEKQDAALLAESNLKAVKRQHGLVKQRYALDLLAEVDVQQATARLQQALAQEAESGFALFEARINLQAMTGSSYQTLNAIQSIGSTHQLNEVDVDFPEKNISYLLEKARVEIAKKELAIEKAARYPKLELVVEDVTNVSDASLAGPGSRNGQTMAMVQASIPLFSGGETSARIKSKRLQLKHRESVAELVRGSVLNDRKVLKHRQVATLSKLRAQALGVRASATSLRIKKEKYLEGMETTTDVLEEQHLLFEAMVARNKTFYERAVLQVEHRALLGQLNQAVITDLF